MPLIAELEKQFGFTVAMAGYSVEKREIFHIRWGSGSLNVLLWSQMHGNESTATMALLDLFRFLQDDDDFNELRNLLNSRLTLHFLPMLNPDGAEKFTRRNAMNIDINRDALLLVTPEAQLLNTIHKNITPAFGFNLHDQNIRTSTGADPQPATLSFLAPPADPERTITPSREKAMQIISRLNRDLVRWIPGKTGRYSDAWEPRAFGDTFQNRGTSTVLIESGGYPEDPEKQYIRKLNFLALTDALLCIADGSYQRESTEHYFMIPENGERLFDLLIRGVRCRFNDYNPVVDIGINRNEITFSNDQRYYYRSSVADIGDLTSFNGYNIIDGDGLDLAAGKVCETRFSDTESLKRKAASLLKEGFTGIKMKGIPEYPLTTLPVNLHYGRFAPPPVPIIGGPADFILTKAGKPVTGIINGFIFDLVTGHNGVKNALVYGADL